MVFEIGQCPHIFKEPVLKILEMVGNEIYQWKADDLNFIIDFYLGGPFSFDCTLIDTNILYIFSKLNI